VIYFLLRSFLRPISTLPTPSNALRFRVLFADAGASRGSSSGSEIGDTRTSGCRRRLTDVNEFASVFATFETTFVAVASVLSKSPLLETASPDPDPDSDARLAA
jgi:hypothetical protein